MGRVAGTGLVCDAGWRGAFLLTNERTAFVIIGDTVQNACGEIANIFLPRETITTRPNKVMNRPTAR